MTILRSMVTNTAARSVTEIINRLGSVIFWVFVARYLGPKGLGSIAFSLSLFTFFGTVATLGLGSAVIRDVAKNPGRRGLYFSNTLFLGFFSSIFFALLMIVVARLINPSPATLFATMLMAVAILPFSGFYWSRTILWALEKLSYVAVARTAETVFKIAGAITVLMLGYGLTQVIIVLILSRVVSFIICFAFAVRMVDFKMTINKWLIRNLLRQAPSFSLIAVFNAMFWSLTVVFITKFRGDAEAGLYSAAFKFVDICISFAHAYGQALFPILSRLTEMGPKLLDVLFRKSLKYLTLITMAIATSIAMLAEQLIPLIFGPAMVGAVPILRVLIWLIIPFGNVPILAYILISYHRQKQDLLANMVATTVLVILLILTVPLWGAMGASVSLLVGCSVFFAVEVYSVHSGIKRLRLSLKSTSSVLSIAFMAVAFFTLKGFNPIIQIISGGFIFLFYLWVTGHVADFENNFLRQLKSV